MPDALGSAVALLDNTQAQTDTLSYWPYGKVNTIHERLRIEAKKRTAVRRLVWIFWAAVGLLSVWVTRTYYVQSSLDADLICAVKRLDAPAVKKCLGAGANPNTTDAATSDPMWIRMLAHLARERPGVVYEGDAALLAVLKSCADREDAQSADMTTGDRDLPPSEPTEIVSALLDKGADANVQIIYGETAISYAQRRGYKQCVRMLLEHGARANGAAFDRSSLLMLAICRDDSDTVYELIKHGADVNAADCDPMASTYAKPGVQANPARIRPLAYAMSHASIDFPARQRVIKLLTEAGAHP